MLTLIALLGATAAAQEIITEADIAALPTAEAYRLMFVVPGGSDWPEDTVLQWEASRGHLRLYLTNHRADTLYLDWGESRFVDAAGQTWPLRAASRDAPTREAIAPGQLYQETLALVGGSDILYDAGDVGLPIELTLSLEDASGSTTYWEHFEIGIDLDEVARSLAAEERHLYEFQRRRTVTATALGVLLAGAGTYLLADRSLGERDGVLDTELNTTRLSVGGGALGLGVTLITASSIRRGGLTRKIEALGPHPESVEADPG